jgi:hypothetical protein
MFTMRYSERAFAVDRTDRRGNIGADPTTPGGTTVIAARLDALPFSPWHCRMAVSMAIGAAFVGETLLGPPTAASGMLLTICHSK